MRHSFLASLSLFCFLFSKVSGARLEKEFPSRSPQNQLQEENALIRTSSQNNNDVEVTSCINGRCKGNNRKPSTTSTSSANTTSKNGGLQDDRLLKKNDADDEKYVHGNEETSEVNSSAISKYREIVPENYPDLTDIAEMDYSPARRKPPVHN